MNDRTLRILKVLFAAHAITFAIVLIAFIVVMFNSGVKAADDLWFSPFSIGVWILALAFSWKHLKR